MKKLAKDNSKIIKFILVVFLVWQTAIICASLISSEFLTLQKRFVYNDGPKIMNPVFLWNRANFDGIHYLDIARKGYGIYQQAFFPLYPKLIRFLTPLFGGKDLLAGVFISNFSLIIALWFFYQLILLDYEGKIAVRILIFFLLFPTSFFFGLAYTESLFLLLVLGSFYAARKKKWFLAGILGALASNTRLVGVFLFPALIWEWWQQIKTKNSKLVPPSANWRTLATHGKTQNYLDLLSLFFVPFGLLSYMRFLDQMYNDPLMFVHVQPFFGAERSGGRIILIYQVFWRYLKMILTTKLDPLYFTVWLELVVAIIFLFFLLQAYRKKIRFSYLIFSIFAYFAPTFSGTFSSMPRYVLGLFPCFIYLGTIENKFVRSTLLITFGLVFIFAAILFFRGYWIA